MKILDLKTLRGILRNPGSDLRSLPFWGWNDHLQEDELRRQLEDMQAKGLGGCFSHARDGIETPYLSDEWMDAARIMVEEGQKRDLHVWIYDEDKWPSGSAGGMVSALDPDAFTAKGLTLEVRSRDEEPDPITEGERLIGDYTVTLNGRTITAFDAGETVIRLRREISGKSEWYNGYAPSDNMNADAVRAFVDLTHERYKKAFGGTLNGKVDGFFTDEPNVYDFFACFKNGRPWLPWTDDFTEEFKARRGYSVVDQLPLLFFDGDGSTRIRHDYWRTVTELFSERYMKQIYDWCEENHVRFTGHILYENDLGYNIRVCGAAMPQYRYLHAPGIDLLGEQTREYLTVKQCTSVANQYGRDMVISETYGTTGWEFDFAGMKWLGDWQFVMGVNRRCMHMMQYSITGCRKRDYPPVFNYQNTWWAYEKRMEDYYARLSACIGAGEVVRDILVIHPISSLWTMCASDPNEDLNNIEMNQGWRDPQFTELNRLGERYNRLAEILVRSHHDFDFGDEIILSEIGSVVNGCIRVGQAEYPIIIVPEVTSLFASTVELLRKFEQNGGRIIWAGKAPTMIEGVPSGDAEAVYRNASVLHVEEYDELPFILNDLCGGTMRIASREGGDAKEILAMLRRVGNDHLLFTVNHDRTNANGIRVELPVNGKVTAYDAWNDVYTQIECDSDGRRTVFTDTIEPNGSKVYFVESDAEIRTGRTDYPYVHPHFTESVFAILGPAADVRRTAPNALTLDMCTYTLNGSDRSDSMEVWQAQRRIREELGMQQVYYNGIPQRYTWLNGKGADIAVPFTMCFGFEVHDVPKGKVYAAIEKPGRLRLECNGKACRLTDDWYVDRAIRMFELPELSKGRNQLVLAGDYTLDIELEDIYILGDFAVTPERVITSESGRLHFGDWCQQGYFHYNGAMIYTFNVPYEVPKGKRIVLKMGDYSGVLTEIMVNGVTAGVLFGECCRTLDITDFLKDRDNMIEVKVVGTPRNLMGPFHQAYDGCSRISWADFRTEGNMYCEDYSVYPYGLMGKIRLLQM